MAWFPPPLRYKQPRFSADIPRCIQPPIPMQYAGTGALGRVLAQVG